MGGSPAGRRVGAGLSGVGTFRQGASVPAFLSETVGGRRPARVWAVLRLVVCQTAARRGAAAPSSIQAATAWCQYARSWAAASSAVTAPPSGIRARSWLRAWSRASKTGAHLSVRHARRWERTALAQSRSASASRWLVWGVRVSRRVGSATAVMSAPARPARWLSPAWRACW